MMIAFLLAALALQSEISAGKAVINLELIYEKRDENVTLN